MNNKILYDEFCENNKEFLIFYQPWWLDTVCGPNNWDVVLYIKNKEILGAFPYFFKKKFGLRLLITPKFSHIMGPLVSEKIETNLDKSKIISELIKMLPKFNYLSINLNYTLNDWRPFYWKSYLQSTNYTCIIENLCDEEKIFNNFSSANKRMIKKANLNELRFNSDITIEEFYQYYKFFLGKRKKVLFYSYDEIKNIIQNLKKKNQGCTFSVSDKKNNILSIALIIWDKKSSYMILNSTDPEMRNTGCSQYLIKEILSFLKEKTKSFSFEGSMNKEIFTFYNSFGGNISSYYKIVKSNPSYLRYLINDNNQNFIEI